MSLWFQGLLMNLDVAGDGRTHGSRVKRAKVILTFLCLPVPRGIVTRYVESGKTDTDVPLFSIMGNCLELLHEVKTLAGLDMGHLLALGVAAEPDESGKPRFLDPAVPHALSRYVKAAELVLKQRPDLRALGERIERAQKAKSQSRK